MSLNAEDFWTISNNNNNLTTDFDRIYYYDANNKLTYLGSIVNMESNSNLNENKVLEKLFLYDYYDSSSNFIKVSNNNPSSSEYSNNIGLIFQSHNNVVLKFVIPIGIKKVIIKTTKDMTSSGPMISIIANDNRTDYSIYNRVFTIVKSNNESAAVNNIEQLVHESYEYSHLSQIKNIFYQVSVSDFLSAKYVDLLSRVNKGCMLDNFFIAYDLSRHWIGSYYI